uniref:AIG1-type G domain-containing protein n=1 Tax=Salmo trutta TaxID=8032 RepID=A0A674A701_SALTR
PNNVATQVLLEEIHGYEQNRASRTPFLVHIRVVLLGKTGGGKSSAGNTIFGQDDVFLSDSSSTSSTQKCKAQTKNIKGRNITLIDTPGFFDTDIPEEELKPKIVKCITECAPGPHAFLIVLKTSVQPGRHLWASQSSPPQTPPADPSQPGPVPQRRGRTDGALCPPTLPPHGVPTPADCSGSQASHTPPSRRTGGGGAPQAPPAPAPERSYLIVLLGKTGGGKSAGNTIFGQDDVFLSDSSSISSTQICEAQTKNIKGRNITLIDTPGFFDTDIPEEELKPKIVKCITECAPGPHAFLIVLIVERYTVHENDAIAKIETYFSPEAFKYATVLFTHGDQLNGLTIEKFVQQNDELNKLVEKCGGRCHVIDNKHWNTNQQGRYSNQCQVAELLNTIEKMVRDNGGGFYTNEMLQEAERLIQAEIESLRNESKGQMSEEEMRKQAKEKVRKKLQIKITGILIGTVIGIAAAVVSGTAATAGAIRGGIVGATAAEEAETVQEAAKKAGSAVCYKRRF